jgi:hypothetical protein
MNAINRATSSIFNLVLRPFELLGAECALILVSGFFGVIALLIFKRISSQDRIKRAKDKIKGHMIAIRIYQDDLAIVFKSVFSVMIRNLQYLALNFVPILPLLAPFTLVAAQFVTRYSFEPIPVSILRADEMMPGRGTTLTISMKPGSEAMAQRIDMRLPSGLAAISPLVRNASDGLAFQEIVANASGAYEIEIFVDGVREGVKQIAAGTARTRMMQPERVSTFWSAWLWPAESTFGDSSPIASVVFKYPYRELRFLPDGPGGVLLVFFLSSVIVGLLLLKPLHIQI